MFAVTLKVAAFINLKTAARKVSCSTVLTLAYQSLGVIYGDLSTSPLYVYTTTFSGKLSLKENDVEIYGLMTMGKKEDLKADEGDKNEAKVASKRYFIGQVEAICSARSHLLGRPLSKLD
ncbi:hypothetical protein QQ045_005639 [Rhodiola kirilowii]